MRVADYVAAVLLRHGVRHVFLVTGGGAMHLNDAFGRSGMEWVPCHHEQACAMAAESYFRASGRLAAVNVTSGPGGTNALTGVFGAWTDSLALIVVSGQVKRETTVRSTNLPLRQLGDQELDIVRLAAPITKYAEMVNDPGTIRYHLEKALYLATSGRPGPVWIDIPLDVQAASVDPDLLPGFDAAAEAEPFSEGDLPKRASDVLHRLQTASRPVVLAGGGIRVSGSHTEFIATIEKLGVPVATAWNAHDVLWDEHPLYVGRPGTLGDRPGNFAVQNADFLLVLGSRLNVRQVGYAWKTFARAAYTVMVDIDAAELAKPTLRIDLPIQADLRKFLVALLAVPYAGPPSAHRSYLEWCRARRARYPVVLPEYWTSSHGVNPYCFVDVLTRLLPEGETIVTGDGTACVCTFQAAVIKRRQRLYTNSGSAAMGYDLPAAIGASLAAGRGRVICLAGDGSIQMNLQELQTIVKQRLPVKVFVLNNGGYHSIRQTQAAYFPGSPVGYDEASGVGFPSFEKLAAAYGLPFIRIANHAALSDGIQRTMDGPGPAMCEVMLDLAQPFAPRAASRRLPDGRMVSSPLEDLAPFLSREELSENLLIPPVES
jgi:acetolactate synthase-1/2/3 large subunit